MVAEYLAQTAHKRVDNLFLRHMANDQFIAHHRDQGKRNARQTCLLKVTLRWYPLKSLTRATRNRMRNTITKLPANTLKMCTWNVRQRLLIQTEIVHTKPRELHSKPTATSTIKIPQLPTLTLLRPFPPTQNFATKARCPQQSFEQY